MGGPAISSVFAIIRNGLSLIKALLPADHALLAALKLSFLPEHFQQMNALEFPIAISQLAGAFFCFMGAKFLWGMSNSTRSQWTGLVDSWKEAVKQQTSTEHQVIAESLSNLRKSSQNFLYTSLSLGVIVHGLLHLVALNLHWRPSNFPIPLLRALTLMNGATLVLVVLDLLGWFKAVNVVSSAAKLAKSLKSKPQHTGKAILTEAAECGFNSQEAALKALNPDFKLDWAGKTTLKENLFVVKTTINELARNAEGGGKAKSMTRLVENLENTALKGAYDNKWALVFILCNVVAFFGYTVPSMTFYCPPDHVFGKSWLGQLLAWRFTGLSENDLTFYGIFVGDLAFTLEPILTLFVKPLVDSLYAPKIKKE